MKKNFLIALILLFGAIMSFYGCKKDPKDGRVTFWTKSSSMLGKVTVTMADGTTGIITYDYDGAPDCGAVGCFTYETEPGTYSYTATEEDADLDGLPDATWNGSVKIIEDDCVTIELK